MITENRHLPESCRRNKGVLNILFNQKLIAKGRSELEGKKENLRSQSVIQIQVTISNSRFQHRLAPSIFNCPKFGNQFKLDAYSPSLVNKSEIGTVILVPAVNAYHFPLATEDDYPTSLK